MELINLNMFLFLVINISSTLFHPTHGGVLPPSPPPAIFVFGDSYVEAGNNNFLQTSSKANYTPYGIDFGFPTGRSPNRKLVVDFVAGLPFPPAMLGMSEAEQNKTVTGVNYASGGSGTLRAPQSAEQIFGHVLSLGEQVSLFKNSTLAMKNVFDSEESFSLHLSKSLFFIHSGSNDLGLFWDFEKESQISQTPLRIIKPVEGSVPTWWVQVLCEQCVPIRMPAFFYKNKVQAGEYMFRGFEHQSFGLQRPTSTYVVKSGILPSRVKIPYRRYFQAFHGCFFIS